MSQPLDASSDGSRAEVRARNTVEVAVSGPPLADPAAGPGRAAQSRLVSLDTLRGGLIVLILVTHGVSALSPLAMSREAREAAQLFFGVATPSFVLISGTLFGLFLATRRNLAPIFRSYRWRALLFALG